jgi:FMN reductase [NAD(P)H]
MSSPTDILNKLFKEIKLEDKLYPKKEDQIQEFDSDEILRTNVMLNRRSQRKFENKEVEDWKLDIIFAAADTAPTAGGFQGFEIFRIKNTDIKIKLVEAANQQPYVNAPVVLVFCMNPARVKMNFPSEF